MSALASDPVEGFQVASEAVAAPHAKAPTATRTRNKLLWQPPTLARYRFGERGLQVRWHAHGMRAHGLQVHWHTWHACVLQLLRM